MKRFLQLMAGLIMVSVLAGCGSRIEQGHVGIRQNWNNTIDPVVLGAGFQPSFTSKIIEVAANEITIPVDDLHPITRDKTTVHDMDLAVMYQVKPEDIPNLYVRFKNRNVVDKDGTVYILYAYLQNIIGSAVFDVVNDYDALSLNDNREKIQNEIKGRIEAKLNEEGLQSSIKIGSIIIRNMQIDQKLTESTLAVIQAQNVLKAKEFEVQTARKEAERMQVLAQQSGPQYIQYMDAQARLVQAQALADAVKSGKVPNWVFMQGEYKGNVNLGK